MFFLVLGNQDIGNIQVLEQYLTHYVWSRSITPNWIALALRPCLPNRTVRAIQVY